MHALPLNDSVEIPGSPSVYRRERAFFGRNGEMARGKDRTI
jgi:hypothetical protein